jgi:hypothetical protein
LSRKEGREKGLVLPRAAKGLKEEGWGGPPALPSVWGKGGGQRKGRRNDEKKRECSSFEHKINNY